jgi:xanthine dehydrogenase accessory factor
MMAVIQSGWLNNMSLAPYNFTPHREKLVVVRGAGDLATGIIWTLHKAGYKVCALDIEKPSAIRRTISYCEAIYDGSVTIDSEKCEYAKNIDRACEVMEDGNIALMIDEKGENIKTLNPDVVVDAIIAKKNLGTTIDMAKLVIGVGPGFTAKKDCHFAIETIRGHNLGRIIEDGSPIPNTGIPGDIAGFASERVIHSKTYGIIENISKIGDIVKKDQVLAKIYECNIDDINDYKKHKAIDVKATIDGVLRGLIRDKFYIPREGFKIADIDPRGENAASNCHSISDKARLIGGGVLLCIDNYFYKN